MSEKEHKKNIEIYYVFVNENILFSKLANTVYIFAFFTFYVRY